MGRVDLTLDSIQTNGSHGRVEIRLSALPDDRLEVVASALRMPRKSLAANVVLVNRGNLAGVSAKVAQTALGGLRGSLDLSTPVRSKHIGIFFGVKCNGEAARRPNLRTPPLQRGRQSRGLSWRKHGLD